MDFIFWSRVDLKLDLRKKDMLFRLAFWLYLFIMQILLLLILSYFKMYMTLHYPVSIIEQRNAFQLQIFSVLLWTIPSGWLIPYEQQ